MSAQCLKTIMLWELGTLLCECYAKRVVVLAATCNSQQTVRIGYLDGPIPNNEQQPLQHTAQHPMTSRQKDLSRVRYPVRSLDALSVALFVATSLFRSLTTLLSFFLSL